jgi:hypothetical protein
VRLSRRIATKAPVTAFPVVATLIPTPIRTVATGAARKLLHEQELTHPHPSDLERQQPTGAPAHPVHGGGVEPLDDAGEGEEQGGALDPPDAQKLGHPIHVATVASALPGRRHPAGRLSALDKRCVTIYRDTTIKKGTP